MISGSVRQGSLPHFNPDLDHDPLPPEVVELRRLIDEACLDHPVPRSLID